MGSGQMLPGGARCRDTHASWDPLTAGAEHAESQNTGPCQSEGQSQALPAAPSPPRMDPWTLSARGLAMVTEPPPLSPATAPPVTVLERWQHAPSSPTVAAICPPHSATSTHVLRKAASERAAQ